MIEKDNSDILTKLIQLHLASRILQKTLAYILATIKKKKSKKW